MNFKILFLVSAVLTGLVSCSNDDNLNTNGVESNDATLNLGFNIASLSTRATEAPLEGDNVISPINEGSLYLLKGSTISDLYSLSAEQKNAINDAKEGTVCKLPPK